MNRLTVLSFVVGASLACGGSNGGAADGGSIDADPNRPDAPPACTEVPGTPNLTTQLVTGGLSSPVFLTAPAGDPRLFVVEQPGRIRIIANGALLPAPFLDISGIVVSGGEQGLLGLAFHPNYAQNGRFFVNYTEANANGATAIAEYAVSGDPDLADPTERRLLTIAQPYSNHNGGMIAFSRTDGFLYIGMGDGGSGGDPQDRAQNIDELLGKLLRIDVDSGNPYGVPAANPFVGVAGADEIWALGLRNPWRFSFDRETDDLYIGDVGQNAWEEIDVEAAGSTGGVNYGWDDLEGTQCYEPMNGCLTADRVNPVYEYSHGEGCSVTGGYVYRGCTMPGHHGKYFFSDYCSGFIRSFEWNNGVATNVTEWPDIAGLVSNVSSFGEDADGELYILSLGAGTVRKVVPGP